MRSLSLKEIKDLSGGSFAAATGIAISATMVTVAAALYLTYANRCHYEDTIFTTRDPVYDPYTGKLIGYTVNEFVRTDLVCP